MTSHPLNIPCNDVIVQDGIRWRWISRHYHCGCKERKSLLRFIRIIKCFLKTLPLPLPYLRLSHYQPRPQQGVRLESTLT